MADQGEMGFVKAGRNKRDAIDRNVSDDDFEEEPDFNDPKSFVDPVSDEELVGDLLRKKPKESDGLESVIVVDNVPVVGKERLDKLTNVLRKIFAKHGKIQTEYFPMDGDKTKGYVFMEYQNPTDAEEAVKQTNGYKLDKNHTFVVNLFSDFEKYANEPDTWVAPEPQPFADHGNLKSWLLDSSCYDQFSVIYDGGNRTAIFVNSAGEPTNKEERNRWTETYVRWSSQGTYLATFHSRGIALWGGEAFQQINRFGHTGVQLIDFSPCERYMVTFSPLKDNKDDPQAIIIWDIRTGQKKRGFHCDNAPVWPIFKWNYDGRYFARMSKDAISIYETPSFGLLDKKSIKIDCINDFSWSPTNNIIAYWTPEDRDTPARVTLINIPDRVVLAIKNLFTVADAKMHWQKNGDYLCVNVDRYRSRKEDKDGTVKFAGIFHNFNVFRMREKQIPVDIVEVKDSIMAFAWEPVGHKFAIIHGESPRISISFYQVKKGGSVELIKTMDKKQANHLFWSPRGQFLVVAGLRSMNGTFEFIDTSDMTIMAVSEHFMATNVEWDPTGRYVATAVSWWEHKVDNAYWLWNFQGRLLNKQPMDKICQFLWRPRPISLLDETSLRAIKKNMKTFHQRFALEDKMRESKASKEQIEKRRTMLQEFKEWQEHIDEIYDMGHDQRLILRKGVETDELEHTPEDFEEEVIEFLLKVEETVIDE